MYRIATPVILLAALASAAPAQTELQKLVASDGGHGDQFGASLALDGDVLIAGARSDGPGSAYVFRCNAGSWIEEQKLVATNGFLGELFGQSVAINGNLAIVGAPNSISAWGGAAYVFRKLGASWVQQQKLTANDGQTQAMFGADVAVDGDIMVVGSPFTAAGGSGIGAAFVFEWDGAAWVEQQVLAPNDADSSWFGLHVTIEDDVIVVGVPFGLVSNGSHAYVFRWNGASWVKEQKIVPSAPAIVGLDAGSVAIDEDVLVLNSNVFRWDGSAWAEEQQLVASGGAVDILSGIPAIQGDEILVGTPGADSQQGAAYLFHWTGISWIETAKVVASDGQASDQFGAAVALGPTMASIGAINDNIGGGLNQGSAYIFSMLDPVWTDLCGALPGTHGPPAHSALGDLSPNSPLTLDLTDALEDSTTTLVLGLSILAAPFKGGTLVPQPDIVVAGLPTNANGDLTIAGTWPAGVLPGFTFTTQFWITDPAGPFGFSASNAILGVTP